MGNRRLRKPTERYRLTISLSFEGYQMLEELVESEGGGPVSRYIERLIRVRHQQEAARLPEVFGADNSSTEIVMPKRNNDRPRPKHLAPVAGKGG